MLEGLDTEDLDTLQILNELRLVVPYVVRQGSLLLLHPLVGRTERTAIATELLRWDDLSWLALASTGELGALDILSLGRCHCFLVDLDEVFLFFLSWLGMLVGLVVGGRQVCYFLDRLPFPFDFKRGNILLRWIEFVERTVDDDLLADLFGRCQVHRGLPLIVFQADTASILDQQGNNVGTAFHGCEMEWRPSVLIKTVDVRAVHQQSLQHTYLSRELVENSVVKGCTTRIVRHMHQIGRVPA